MFGHVQCTSYKLTSLNSYKQQQTLYLMWYVNKNKFVSNLHDKIVKFFTRPILQMDTVCMCQLNLVLDILS